jgi:phospholipid-binding lipoprotein MlaA
VTAPRPASLALLALLVFTGCATIEPPQPDNDPYEHLNRNIFAFNEAVDTWALEPVAKGWRWAVPEIAQRGLVNFFNNLRLPIVLTNDILQGQPRLAAETIGRFQANTFIGFLGFWDIAADFGVPAHIQDSGLSLARAGIKPGPFLMMPVFGPSNLRDILGFGIDTMLNIYPFFVTIPGVTVGLTAIDVVNRRARAVDQVDEARRASIDFYSFIRNAYVQRRWKEVVGQTPAGGAQEEDLYDVEIFEDQEEEGGDPGDPNAP